MSSNMHKFEMHYIDVLIRPEGKYEAKEERDKLYAARSPISHVEKIVCPLLVSDAFVHRETSSLWAHRALSTTLTTSQILQGEEDTVVPRSQAQVMYDTIKARGGVAELQVRSIASTIKWCMKLTLSTVLPRRGSWLPQGGDRTRLHGAGIEVL